jgi:hypothetical protein
VSAPLTRFIFLDIDGVLRTWPATCPFFTNTFGRRVPSYNCRAVRALNWLVRTTGAKIVMTSVWREQGKVGMQRDLQDWGVHARITSMVARDCRTHCRLPMPSRCDCDRSRQIERWLLLWMLRHLRQGWTAVALDDDLTLAEGVLLVQTTIEDGLTWEKADMAYAYLTGQY